MKNSTPNSGEAPVSSKKREIAARTTKAIDSGDFAAYQLAIMHDWLRTLTLMASLLVPVFFALDFFMMPASLLPRFAVYRGASTLLALLQLCVVRRTSPSRWSYLHGYLMTLQVGGMIALMTADLGGFSSSYYAGLNLVVMGVNLLMPWGALHTAANAMLTLGLYLLVNILAGLPIARSSLVNNLFFLAATAILATAINYVRTRLLKREFSNLVDLGEVRDALVEEKGLVEDRERSLSTLLDLSGQGFLSFDPAYIVQSEYSKECDKIFGRGIAGLRIDELLYADPASRANFRSGLDLYFGGKSKAEVIFDLLDHNLAMGDRTVRADYRAIHEARVMIGGHRCHRRDSGSRRKRAGRTRSGISFSRSFPTGASSPPSIGRPRLSSPNSRGLPDGYESLVRNIHTFKGNAGFLGFYQDSECVARPRGLYRLPRRPRSAGGAGGARSHCSRDAFEEERAIVSRTLGSEWSLDPQSIELGKSEYMMIESHIKMNCHDQPILQDPRGTSPQPLAELLGRFPPMVADLASRMGKRDRAGRGARRGYLRSRADELPGAHRLLLAYRPQHGGPWDRRPREEGGEGQEPGRAVGSRHQGRAGEIVFTFSDDGQGIPWRRCAGAPRRWASSQGPVATCLPRSWFRSFSATGSRPRRT